ncbi:Na(+)-translocating NADH-quinone reductase subunit E [Thermosipho melanesiensis]|nr:Na(+)-translocating NADH-quinone reductase subunit E [Thermosipho melanesiensis]OOC36747.1 Na(+)-translocating NADH-quinone reductase subunit E [Thermosipho melanesiensis]OOC39324.1 Na(+)-translocating NADH-quinone reductase subunit E [Thermosipho melanesiensis]OOC39410.1 Na(+)-translocating NADH-quinone reductase subunit E [Thermosipho melanesiensis]OOC41965.1 Na(+)-translocating NADH-quinone reductase subunit E [Thermosipho melanesiensis]
MMPNINPFVLFFASIFTSNILLSNFLGMCSFISISKSLKSSNGLGMAVTMVMTIATVLNWIVEKYIIVSFNIEYLRYIVYIVVIASVVQILEMVIDRVSPNLYISLGIFLPLITVNCAILGVVLFMQLRNYSLIQSVFFGLGSGIGWWLAIVLLAAIRIKVDKAPVPAPLKGVGITLITIGIMAMAFIGFAGMINVQ